MREKGKLGLKRKLRIPWGTWTYSKLNHQSVHDASNHGDQIENVPGVFEVTLQMVK